MQKTSYTSANKNTKPSFKRPWQLFTKWEEEKGEAYSSKKPMQISYAE